MDDDQGNTFNLVVAGEDGGDWILLGDTRSIAWADQAFDISYVGPVSKSALEGRQGPDRVRYFDFPLTNGKEWRTQWDGLRVDVHATRAADGTYTMVGTRDDGVVHVEYTYKPSTRFFGHMEFLDENGTVQYTLTTTGTARGFDGTLYRYGSPQTLADEVLATGDTLQATVLVPEGQADLAVELVVRCATGAGIILMAFDAPGPDGSADLLPPAPVVGEPTFGTQHECPADGDMQRSAILEPVPGDWRLDAVVGASDGQMEVHVAWRPYEELAVGSA